MTSEREPNKPALNAGRPNGGWTTGPSKRAETLEGPDQIPRQVRQHLGGTRCAAGVAAEKLKAGAKLEDFAVHKGAATRKASPKKSKKRHKTKSRKVKRQIKRREAPSKPAEQASSRNQRLTSHDGLTQPTVS
jgi:hypothetical protein